MATAWSTYRPGVIVARRRIWMAGRRSPPVAVRLWMAIGASARGLAVAGPAGQFRRRSQPTDFGVESVQPEDLEPGPADRLRRSVAIAERFGRPSSRHSLARAGRFGLDPAGRLRRSPWPRVDRSDGFAVPRRIGHPPGTDLTRSRRCQSDRYGSRVDLISAPARCCRWRGSRHRLGLWTTNAFGCAVGPRVAEYQVGSS